mmetsp:Transcript_28686/g.54964  ORF Transcript_28686/g.54964 Transcript_28686/m.54964 type:complete len:155 (-) Transcript_28686:385-849(-)|eukprot:CAMPEP_0114256360 /NCGR_PEP_ID=MMETSP0058-20121206/18106_1 /TAXON_ID=36894 /ORGANISM="Pyramimonas parkeae, CCMP726" /LENGTH=154 /DNA_ID=CAMNT_0001370911 /DNA_START=87 /DNA_END=551 /DNA_ORIENTATION=-
MAALSMAMSSLSLGSTSALRTSKSSRAASAPPRAGPVRVAAEGKFGPDAASFDAIIEIGGGQQIVSAGRYYSCNTLHLEPGTELSFERVLAVKGDGELQIGQPYVSGASVQATVLEEYKGKKQIIFKMKSKKHYRRKQGHRQQLTKFLVTGVTP